MQQATEIKAPKSGDHSDPAVAKLVSAKRWEDLVRFLERNPHEASRVNALNGRTPLHLAIEFSAPLPAIEAVLAAASPPSVALRRRDASGRTPLHLSLNSRADVALALLAGCPESASIPDDTGDLPLHRALALGAPAAVLTELLKAYCPADDDFLERFPFGADALRSFVDSAPLVYRRKVGTPLHLGIRILSRCKYRDRVQALLQTITEAFSEALQTPDVEGRLPLSLALILSGESNVVQTLLEAYPEAAGKADNDKRFALHHACANAFRIDVERYEAIMNAFPDGPRMLDRDGSTPLHLAMARSMTLDDLNIVVRAYPAAITIENDSGKTPLDVFFDTAVTYIQKCKETGNDENGTLRSFVEMLARKIRYLAMVLAHGVGRAEKDIGVTSEDSDLPLIGLCYCLPRCPVEIIRYVAIFNRHLVSRPIEGGRLPLHQESALARTDMSDGRFVNGLIREHPAAIKVRDPITNMYPLGLMLQNGRTWKSGVKLALQNFPQALTEQDLKEAVISNALARLGCELDLNAFYILFHERPDCCHRS
mmetsp:Transcript_10194/g.30123  ORF Transcript_10194/g.30123 Transcript_10194/m.30123 type:complete len:540 (-) Transcript_10194:427-2046(-)